MKIDWKTLLCMLLLKGKPCDGNIPECELCCIRCSKLKKCYLKWKENVFNNKCPRRYYPASYCSFVENKIDYELGIKDEHRIT